MPMMNPSHPGRIVRDDLEALGLSVAEAAEGLGISRQQLYNVINGKSSITPEMAIRLEQGIGSTAGAWLRMQSAYNLAQVRLSYSDIHIAKLKPRIAAEEKATYRS